MEKSYSEEEEPGVFFVNPDGFKASKHKSSSNSDNIFSLLVEAFSSKRSKDEIVQELNQKYPALVKDKLKPLLIFDTCSHTGKTINNIKKILDTAGFGDIRVMTADSPDSGSGVKSEISFDSERWTRSCYPFGRDTLLDKNNHSITSELNDMPDRAMGAQIRKEIRDIVKDRLENPNALIF